MTLYPLMKPSGSRNELEEYRSVPIKFPAPSKGLLTNRNISVDVPATALILDNWLPTHKGARVRRGAEKRAIVTGAADIIESFTYVDGASKSLFVSTGTEIFDVTAPATPPTTTGPAVVTGLTSGDWITTQFETPGNVFLVLANGADSVRNFDGTTWTTPSITGVTSSTLNFVWSYGTRLFFLQNDSMDVYYLPVDSIAGAAAVFPMGGVFRKGGKLIAGFSWSIDASEGPSNLCGFLTSEGEIAVYSGIDPGAAATFVLKGVYDIGRPLGKHALMKAGGDVVIATYNGLVPVSSSFTKDVAALQSVAVSRPIENKWLVEVARRGEGWKIGVWRDAGYAFITLPEVTGLLDTIYVVNILTGAWATISGWNARTMSVHDGGMFYGSLDGVVCAADVGPDDDGELFVASYLGTFQTLDEVSRTKQAKIATSQFVANGNFKARLFVNTDFSEILPPAPNVGFTSGSGDVWGTGLWGTAEWSSLEPENYQLKRQAVRGVGDHMAMGVMVTAGGGGILECELLDSHLQLEPGMSSA